MKVRLSLAGVVAVAMALALFGVLNGVDRSQALIPQPIQPFGPADVGGLSSTQLGAAIINHSDAEIIKGERAALPWNFTPPGFDLDGGQADSGWNARWHGAGRHRRPVRRRRGHPCLVLLCP